MGNIKFGCQTYSWFMSWEKYKDRLLDIVEVMAASGYDGIEIAIDFLTDDFYETEKENAFREKLKETGMDFISFGMGLPWMGDDETDEEYQIANRSIELVKRFPGTILMLSHNPTDIRDNVSVKQNKQINIVNKVAKRAKDAGLEVSYHPCSFGDSLFRNKWDYERLYDLLDWDVTGFTPDSGHIAHGCMELLDILKKYMPHINHCHFKDMTKNHNWVQMGEGSIDFPAAVRYLKNNGYDRSIVVECESYAAECDPNLAAKMNGDYIKNNLRNI